MHNWPFLKIWCDNKNDPLSENSTFRKNIFIFFLGKDSKYSKLHHNESFSKLYALLEKCFHGLLHFFTTNGTLLLFGLHNCIAALFTKWQVPAIHEDIHTFWSFWANATHDFTLTFFRCLIFAWTFRFEHLIGNQMKIFDLENKRLDVINIVLKTNI